MNKVVLRASNAFLRNMDLQVEFKVAPDIRDTSRGFRSCSLETLLVVERERYRLQPISLVNCDEDTIAKGVEQGTRVLKEWLKAIEEVRRDKLKQTKIETRWIRSGCLALNAGCMEMLML